MAQGGNYGYGDTHLHNWRLLFYIIYAEADVKDCGKENAFCAIFFLLLALFLRECLTFGYPLSVGRLRHIQR